jgi:hypothetical protein
MLVYNIPLHGTHTNQVGIVAEKPGPDLDLLY